MESLICEEYSPFAGKNLSDLLQKVEAITASIRFIGGRYIRWHGWPGAGHLCIKSMNLFTSRTANRDKCVPSEGNTSTTCRRFWCRLRVVIVEQLLRRWNYLNLWEKKKYIPHDVSLFFIISIVVNEGEKQRWESISLSFIQNAYAHHATAKRYNHVQFFLAFSLSIFSLSRARASSLSLSFPRFKPIFISINTKAIFQLA